MTKKKLVNNKEAMGYLLNLIPSSGWFSLSTMKLILFLIYLWVFFDRFLHDTNIFFLFFDFFWFIVFVCWIVVSCLCNFDEVSSNGENPEEEFRRRKHVTAFCLEGVDLVHGHRRDRCGRAEDS